MVKEIRQRATYTKNVNPSGKVRDWYGLHGIGRVCLGCVLWLLIVTIPGSTSPSPNPGVVNPEVVNPGAVDTLQQIQQHIEQQRSTIIKESDRISNVEQSAQKKLGVIELNLKSTDTANQDYNGQIQLANQRLDQLQEDLAIAERSYYLHRAAIIARLRFLQRQPNAEVGSNLLLKSQDINEFLARRRRLKLVYQTDQKILTSLKAEADSINQRKTEIEAQKNRVSLLKQQLLAKKKQFEAQLRKQQQLIDRLNSNRQALEASQAQLAEDSKNLVILIQREIARQNKIAAARKARLRKTFVFNTGQLLYPSNGSITSSFGWRRHPILGTSRFHSGIDFGASYGSTIRAADSGIVIFAGWYGGYGNTVIIDHGDSIATLYGHASRLLVSKGESVKRGNAIATVGSTGFSTGPHLHFEVRKNGEPVDPASYL
ncbi:peptidoglycan DD-metalloendopeptidase family protein [Moorena sp. SIO4A5]|uniref:murein hydrolase activator EnvC family protein n=1 Tax=Moorena sp. SIO4A5 TaxID=2607838 RepID=UPI0025E16F4A|nr:peptidoglycan DD-metalloendopeptidase family protein [Moorena sp. SIO4A5]